MNLKKILLAAVGILVAFLAFTSPKAHAHSWVLWQKEQDFGQNYTIQPKWYILDAYEAKNVCEDHAKFTWSGMSKSSQAAIGYQFPTVRLEVKNLDGSPGQTSVFFTFYCLPETVDPRGTY
jgi:hypothetical protein